LVQRDHIKKLQQNGWFSLIGDETTDVSTKEQLAIFFRTVGKDLEPEDIYMGFVEVTSTTAESLEAVILDALTRFNLEPQMCRGQAYDGASNMAGKLSGLQARIQAREPRAIFLHCLNHCLNLNLQDIAREEPLVGNAFTVVNDIGVIIGSSAKRKGIFASVCQEQGNQVPSLSGLCQTRWTCRTAALKKCLDAYRDIQQALCEMEQDTKSGLSAKITQKTMEKGKIFLGIRLSWDLFWMAEQVALSLQKAGISFSEGKEAVDGLLAFLESLPHKELVEDAWKEMKELGLSWPQEGRSKKRPLRFRDEDEDEAREGVGEECEQEKEKATLVTEKGSRKRQRRVPEKL